MSWNIKQCIWYLNIKIIWAQFCFQTCKIQFSVIHKNLLLKAFSIYFNARYFKLHVKVTAFAPPRPFLSRAQYRALAWKVAKVTKNYKQRQTVDLSCYHGLHPIKCDTIWYNICLFCCGPNSCRKFFASLATMHTPCATLLALSANDAVAR